MEVGSQLQRAGLSLVSPPCPCLSSLVSLQGDWASPSPGSLALIGRDDWMETG